MQIRTLRKMRYASTFIYIMQFGYVFQYLFAWNDEIYQGNITMKPSFKNRFLYFIGKRESPYTIADYEEGEKIILSGAIISIDKIIADGGFTRQFEKKKAKQIKDIEEDVKARSSLKCIWRAIDMKEGFYYECLTHGMLVKMEDGQQPQHDVISPITDKEVATQTNG